MLAGPPGAHGAGVAAVRTQAAQMQAWRCAVGGTRASSAGGKCTVVHQQGGWAWPVARATSLAQALGWPHSGQRQGSTAGACMVAASVAPLV